MRVKLFILFLILALALESLAKPESNDSPTTERKLRPLRRKIQRHIEVVAGPDNDASAPKAEPQVNNNENSVEVNPNIVVGVDGPKNELSNDTGANSEQADSSNKTPTSGGAGQVNVSVDAQQPQIAPLLPQQFVQTQYPGQHPVNLVPHLGQMAYQPGFGLQPSVQINIQPEDQLRASKLRPQATGELLTRAQEEILAEQVRESSRVAAQAAQTSSFLNQLQEMQRLQLELATRATFSHPQYPIAQPFGYPYAPLAQMSLPAPVPMVPMQVPLRPADINGFLDLHEEAVKRFKKRYDRNPVDDKELREFLRKHPLEDLPPVASTWGPALANVWPYQASGYLPLAQSYYPPLTHLLKSEPEVILEGEPKLRKKEVRRRSKPEAQIVAVEPEVVEVVEEPKSA